MLIIEPLLFEIIAWTFAINNEETLLAGEDKERVMPDVTSVIDTLPAARLKRTKGRGNERISADKHQPRFVLQRKEELRAERVSLHELHIDRQCSRLGQEQTYIDRAPAGRDIDLREIVDARGESLIDRDDIAPGPLDHLTEWREGGLCEWRNGNPMHREHPRKAAQRVAIQGASVRSSRVICVMSLGGMPVVMAA